MQLASSIAARSPACASHAAGSIVSGLGSPLSSAAALLSASAWRLAACATRSRQDAMAARSSAWTFGISTVAGSSAAVRATVMKTSSAPVVANVERENAGRRWTVMLLPFQLERATVAMARCPAEAAQPRIPRHVQWHLPSGSSRLRFAVRRCLLSLRRNPVRRFQCCSRPGDKLIGFVEQPLRCAPKGKVDRVAPLLIIERWKAFGFLERHPVLVINSEIERVVGHHPEHHGIAKYAGLAEHAPHRDAAERCELLAQELGKGAAGNHPHSLDSRRHGQ